MKEIALFLSYPFCSSLKKALLEREELERGVTGEKGEGEGRGG
jgi:hypothetical protein